MIEEASKILHHLQFAIGVELVDDTEQEIGGRKNKNDLPRLQTRK